MADWTPMEKAKPEKSDRYWISLKNGEVKIATYDAFNDYFSSGNLAQIRDCAITAWQPMEYPAPYEPPMTEAEARNLLEGFPLLNPCFTDNQKRALIIAVEALEKQIPLAIDKGYTCPICNEVVDPNGNYCQNCGQALEWED